MALNTAEHLAATQMFINERPISIVVKRVTRTSDGQGGFTKSTPTNLSAQTVRKVARARMADVDTRVTEDGSVVVPTAVLIGMPSLNIQRYDVCDIGGVPHEVVFVSRLPEWRTHAEVVERNG